MSEKEKNIQQLRSERKQKLQSIINSTEFEKDNLSLSNRKSYIEEKSCEKMLVYMDNFRDYVGFK